MSQLGIFVDASSVVKSLAGDAGSATPTALGVITIAGGNNIGTSGALNTLTINLDGTTNHAIQLGNVSGSLSSLAVGATGTVLTGVTGADPAFSATPTVTTIYAGTFDTNVAAAGVTLSGTTLSADGTDVDININITAKGAGKVIIDDLQLTTDLAVTEGGTGASTLLDHGLLVGSGTAAVDALAVGATGTILTGVTGADPTWTTATYPSTVTKGDVLVASANNVVGVVNDVVNAGYVLTANAAAAPTFQALPAGMTFASDAETIAGAVTNKAVAPSNLKAKLGTQTLHGLPIGASDSVAIAWTAEPTDGQILIGKTGNQPVLATISSGNNITATAGAGTISIAVTGTTQHAVQVGGAAGQLASLAVGTTGKYLRAVTTADPAWSTLTLPDTVTKGDVLVASADNVVSSVAGATTAGHVLMANGAGSAPTFQVLPASGIATLAGDAGTATGATVTIAGGSNISTSATGATVTVALVSSPSVSGSLTAGTYITATSGDLTLTDGDAIIGNRDAAITSPIAYFKKSRTGAVLTSGDLTGTIKFSGYDGTQYTDSARITSTSSGTIANTRVAGDLKFYTHPDSAAADPTLRLTIASTGAVTIASPDSGDTLTASGLYSHSVGATAQALLVDSNGVVGGLAGSSYTIFVGGTKPSFTASPQCTSLTVSGATGLSFSSSTGTGPLITMPNLSNNNSQLITIRGLTYFTSAGNGASVYIGIHSAENGPGTATGQNNVGLGYYSMYSVQGGAQNTACGAYSLTRSISETGCTAVGYYALGTDSVSGSYDTALGYQAGYGITSGSYNCCLGYNSGSSIRAGSSNINISNVGAVESNTIRIGTQGSGNNQQNICYIAGIYGVTPGGTQNVALIDSNGQLGSTATLPPSLGGAMTWNSVSGTTQALAINNGYVLNNASLTTCTLPASYNYGDIIRIIGRGVGGWKIAQNSGQNLRIQNAGKVTTTGTSGYIQAPSNNTTVTLIGVNTTTMYVLIEAGTITIN